MVEWPRAYPLEWGIFLLACWGAWTWIGLAREYWREFSDASGAYDDLVKGVSPDMRGRLLELVWNNRGIMLLSLALVALSLQIAGIGWMMLRRPPPHPQDALLAWAQWTSGRIQVVFATGTLASAGLLMRWHRRRAREATLPTGTTT